MVSCHARAALRPAGKVSTGQKAGSRRGRAWPDGAVAVGEVLGSGQIPLLPAPRSDECIILLISAAKCTAGETTSGRVGVRVEALASSLQRSGLASATAYRGYCKGTRRGERLPPICDLRQPPSSASHSNRSRKGQKAAPVDDLCARTQTPHKVRNPFWRGEVRLTFSRNWWSVLTHSAVAAVLGSAG